MEFFKIRKDIPFMKHALIFNVISLVTFLLAVFFLFSRGLHLSVEFTGGTVMEVSYSQPADLNQVRGVVSSLGYTDVQVQNFGTARDVMIRLPAQKGVSSAQQSDKLMEALKTQNAEATMRRTEYVGPQVGEELATDGLKALAFVVIGIMLYLAVRFEWKFSVAAIIANLHDVIIILGFFCLLPVGILLGGVHRITQHRQHRGQHRQGEFPLEVGKKAQDNDDVVQVGNDGGYRKFPFKAHCQIKHDANHHKGQSLQAVCRQLFTHLRAHIFCAAHGGFCVLRFQGFHEFVTLLRRTHALLRRQANHHIARCAKVLDLHIGVA